MTVDVIDPQTVRFNLPAPKPVLLVHIATTWAQAFQLKYFLGRCHPGINPAADKLAQEAGFENGLEVIKVYWGKPDYNNTPSALLSVSERVVNLPADVFPTLKSHIIVSKTVEGRRLVSGSRCDQLHAIANAYELCYRFQRRNWLICGSTITWRPWVRYVWALLKKIRRGAPAVEHRVKPMPHGSRIQTGESVPVSRQAGLCVGEPLFTGNKRSE